MTYYMSEILKMIPLLKSYSIDLEIKTHRSIKISEELEPLEQLGRSAKLDDVLRMRALNIELDALLESMLSMTEELKDDFNITICDPTLGAIDIPCWSKSEKTMVLVCYDHTCEADEDEIRCHPTMFGKKEDRNMRWNIT